MSMQKIFDSCPDSESVRSDAEVYWARKGTGFGSFRFYMGSDGLVHCDSEMMGPDFVRSVLNDLVDRAVFDDFKDRTPLKLSDAPRAEGQE